MAFKTTLAEFVHDVPNRHVYSTLQYLNSLDKYIRRAVDGRPTKAMEGYATYRHPARQQGERGGQKRREYWVAVGVVQTTQPTNQY